MFDFLSLTGDARDLKIAGAWALEVVSVPNDFWMISRARIENARILMAVMRKALRNCCCMNQLGLALYWLGWGVL